MATKKISRGEKVKIAVVGLGHRSIGLVKNLLELDSAAEISLVVDPDTKGARQRMTEKLELGEGVPVVPGIDELFKRVDSLDGVIVATRCNLHTPIACQLAKTDLPLFLEKPVAINWQQLEELKTAFSGRKNDIVVSFPLRLTPHLQAVLDIIESGRLGVINQIQAFNNVHYGGVYFHQLYRDYDITGGLWLQKATHDFDYLHALMASQPRTVAAMHSRRIFGGEFEENHHCAVCDEADTCEQSPQRISLSGDGGGVPEEDHPCTFSKTIKNQDAGSALVMYENGAHLSYTQNFVARRSAGKRGAVIVGYDATLSFNWHENQVKVIDHHHSRVDDIKIEAGGGHLGGDAQLLLNFLDIMRGKAESRTTLGDGLLSVATCLAARDSAAESVYQNIPSVAPAPGARRDNAPAVKGNKKVEPPTR